ncbi:MAG: phage protease, partial [Pseudomonadota bacterium]
MSLAEHLTALMSAQSLPEINGQETAPEWIHLLPAGENGVIGTSDARGPYHVDNAANIIAASFSDDSKLPVDQDHATDRAAPKGQPAPARGWIVAMEARADGIWGKVEWTPQGAELVSSRAYRGISPVIVHSKAKPHRVVSILRASLVNKPNLRGMTSLHSEETGMNFREKLIEMLSIDAASSDEDIMKALRAKMKGKGSDASMQSALGEVGVALGLQADAKPADIIAAAQAATKSDDKSIAALQASNAALQSSVTELSATVEALQSGQSEAASETFFQNALAERRAGVNEASKDHWISLHQQDPEKAAKIVAGLPKLDKTATTIEPPAPKDGEVSLNASQRAI